MGNVSNENNPLEEAYSDLLKKLDNFGSRYRLTDDDVRDLLHDGFLKLSDENIDSKSEAKGKFWVTLKNLAIDRFRKEKRFVKTDYSEIIDVKSYEDDFDLKDYNEKLIRRLKALLTPIQFDIMVLKAVQGYDYPEIAALLDISESTVRAHICRARKILKDRL